MLLVSWVLLKERNDLALSFSLSRFLIIMLLVSWVVQKERNDLALSFSLSWFLNLILLVSWILQKERKVAKLILRLKQAMKEKMAATFGKLPGSFKPSTSKFLKKHSKEPIMVYSMYTNPLQPCHLLTYLCWYLPSTTTYWPTYFHYLPLSLPAFWQVGTSNGCLFVSFFFFLILWCSCTGNHPQEELVKFGYKLEKKVENFSNPAIFWQPARTSVCVCVCVCLHEILKKKILWHFFFTKMPCMYSTGLFLVTWWWKFCEGK